MTTFFWVGGSATANFATTNWSTTSGGATGSGPPTSTDVAIFDSNSGTGTCTIAAAVTVQGFDCASASGNYAGTIQHNNFTITINSGAGAGSIGQFRFSSGMTYNIVSLSSLVLFTNTSGTAMLTSAGKNFAQINQNGIGGTVQPQDNLNVTAFQNATIVIIGGFWDNLSAGGGALTLTVASFSAANNTNVRRIDLGGLVKVGGNLAAGGNAWAFTTMTNLTFNKGTANVEVVAPNTAIGGMGFNPGLATPVQFNTLTFDAVSSAMLCTMSWSGTFSIGTLVVAPGWTLVTGSNNAMSIANGFNLVGTPTFPIGITTVGPFYTTITCGGNSALKWGILAGVNIAGGFTYTLTDTLMGGNCTGWAPGPPIDSLLPGQVATAIWQDLLSSSDFSTSASVGALVKAMSNLQFTVPAMARGTVSAGSSTTSIVTSAFDPPGAAANQFANGVVVFDKATATAQLRGQRGLISASSNAAAPILTVGALTVAPASGDTFTVV